MTGTMKRCLMLKKMLINEMKKTENLKTMSDISKLY